MWTASGRGIRLLSFLDSPDVKTPPPNLGAPGTSNLSGLDSQEGSLPVFSALTTGSQTRAMSPLSINGDSADSLTSTGTSPSEKDSFKDGTREEWSAEDTKSKKQYSIYIPTGPEPDHFPCYSVRHLLSQPGSKCESGCPQGGCRPSTGKGRGAPEVFVSGH